MLLGQTDTTDTIEAVVPSIEVIERKIVYPDVGVIRFYGIDDDGQSLALTAATCKEFMGWTEELPEGDPDRIAFGDDYFCLDRGTDTRGPVKCRAVYDLYNRPFDSVWCSQLCSIVLNKHWADSRWRKGATINGESINIGRYGSVINGQHRMTALIWAVQEYHFGDDKDKWHKIWGDQEPTIETLVVVGIDESIETTRTFDYCKRQTLSDVLYRNRDLFGGASSDQRKTLCKILEHCIRFLCHRTGEKKEAFATKQTHGEHMEFLERHPHVLQCISLIASLYGFYSHYGDESKKTLTRTEKAILLKNKKSCVERMTPGYAAGLFYLMACSETEPEPYWDADPPRERLADGSGSSYQLLEFARWDRSLDYWTDLCSGGLRTEPVRKAFAKLTRRWVTGTGTMAEKLAILVLGWNSFVANGEKIDPRDVDLNPYYEKVKGSDTMRLDFTPSVGGIDLGDPDAMDEDDVAERKAQVEREVKESTDPKPEKHTRNGRTPLGATGEKMLTFSDAEDDDFGVIEAATESAQFDQVQPESEGT